MTGQNTMVLADLQTKQNIENNRTGSSMECECEFTGPN
jgi:hypothetical protein